MTSMQPMELAAELVNKTREKRDLDARLDAVKKEIAGLEARILDAMEAGDLPMSFKLGRSTVFYRSDVRASAKDHAQLTEVLKSLGLTEYLPKTVNSNSISAYVREHINDEGEIVDLDPALRDALNITEQHKAIVHL